MEACIRLLEQVLGDGQIDQGGVDVFVAEIGGQIGESFLGLDARAVPRQHAMNDKGVPQIMEPRPDTTRGGLQGRPTDDLRQQVPKGDQLIAPTLMLVPEKRCSQLSGGVTLSASVEIGAELLEDTWSQRELTRLKELGIPNGERRRGEIEIAKRQADEFPQPKARTVGQHHDGGECQRA